MDATTCNKQEDSILERNVRRHLACPRCHGVLDVSPTNIKCDSCRFDGGIRDGVVMTTGSSIGAYFDAMHLIMQETNQYDGTWRLFYEKQVKRLAQLLKPGSVILDVGCGPSLPYTKPPEWFVIGVEPSYESIRCNDAVDLRVHGTGEALPVGNCSVDAILCFYSIHHMTGATVEENSRILRNVFGEFARVIKPGGSLLVFDLSPWWPAWTIEKLTWNLARRRIGSKLDMFFWRASVLAKLGQEFFPQATLEKEPYNASLLTAFPPIFSLPRFKLPRLLYPFDVNLYVWRF